MWISFKTYNPRQRRCVVVNSILDEVIPVFEDQGTQRDSLSTARMSHRHKENLAYSLCEGEAEGEDPRQLLLG